MRYNRVMKLDHVALSISNLEDGIKLFETMSMGVNRWGKHYSTGEKTVFVRNEVTGVDVELIANPGQPAPGFLHFAFVVEDIQAKYQELLSQGYTIERELFLNEAAKMHMAFLRHPAGIILQLNQPA
jgi:catechol 2,3-dioxygenase-like lactoylglutathione lyase family enzyme